MTSSHARSTTRVIRHLLLAGMAIAAACSPGPRVVPVSGRVMMDGKPLTGHRGFVRVVPAGFRAATGSIDPDDGSFALTTSRAEDGCVTGTHPAAVIVNTMVGNRLVWLVSEHYGDDGTSGLIVEVTGPTAALRLNLTGGVTSPPRPTSEDQRLEQTGS